MYVYDPTNAILRERVWLVSARVCALQEYYYLVGVNVRRQEDCSSLNEQGFPFLEGGYH